MGDRGNVAALLLAEIIEHDDENGALANATADDLRDALRLAADRLRCAADGVPFGPIYVGARRLVAEVWWLVQEKVIDSRSRAADAALDLRDSIDTDWWPDHEQEHRRISGGDVPRDPDPSKSTCIGPEGASWAL